MRFNAEDWQADQQWWVDALEQEFDNRDNLIIHASLMAKYSETDKKIISNLRKVRNLISKSDQVDVSTNPEYFKDLQSKIMAQVEDLPAQGVNTEAPIPAEKSKSEWLRQ